MAVYARTYYIRQLVATFPLGQQFSTPELHGLLPKEALPCTVGAISAALGHLREEGYIERVTNTDGTLMRGRYRVIQLVPTPKHTVARPERKGRDYIKVPVHGRKDATPLSARLMELAVLAELLEKTSIETATEEQLIDALVAKRGLRGNR